MIIKDLKARAKLKKANRVIITKLNSLNIIKRKANSKQIRAHRYSHLRSALEYQNLLIISIRLNSPIHSEMRNHFSVRPMTNIPFIRKVQNLKLKAIKSRVTLKMKDEFLLKFANLTMTIKQKLKCLRKKIMPITIVLTRI
jgi:hypothetical protein